MSLPVDRFVSMINAMAIPHETYYRNIPNIVIRINKESLSGNRLETKISKQL
jgi:hypothetical protein